MKPFLTLLTLAGVFLALPDYAAPQTKPKAMTPTKLDLKLHVKAREQALFPEQSAMFDLTLTNEGNAPANIPDLSGNRWTPLFRIFDSEGVLLTEVTLSDLYARFNAEMGEPEETPPQMMSIPAGAAKQSWIDLWSYAAPLPKGTYSLQVRHLLDESSGQAIESDLVPFSVVDAHVLDYALGYREVVRRTSILAWLAAPASGGAPEVLVRVSATSNHSSAQRSGASLGKTPDGSKVALSAKPPEGTPSVQGWLSILAPVGTQGSSLTLSYLNTGMAEWKSDPVTLPVEQAVAVPGFPDRGHAVFLAVGRHQGSSHLVGVVVPPRMPVTRAWSVPLQSNPSQTACVVTKDGPIALLLASDDGQRASLVRIDVDEQGTVTGPERVVHTTSNLLLAVQPEWNSPKRGFVVLEAKRGHPDQLVVVRVPVSGEVQSLDLPPAPGWPAVDGRVLPAIHFQMATDAKGRPLIAFLDEFGHYYAGAADGSQLAVLEHDGPQPRIVLPQIAALKSKNYFAGFAENGVLVHLGGR